MRLVGVIGGGLMGAGIAFTVLTKSDSKVILREVDETQIAGAKSRIQGMADRALKKGTPQAEVDGWLSKIQYTTAVADLADCEIVVEAVFENLDLKKKIFAELDQLIPAPRLLCSNTSGIAISQIAGVCKNPERVIGTHFFNPVPVMKLVEIVTGIATNQTTIDQARAFCEGMGKEVIVAKDFPGFVVTRIGQAMMCEAVRCLEQGVATPEDIDRGMRLGYNYPMGPLELIDLIGVDTELRIMTSMFEEMGETFRPSPIMKSMVAAGRLGRKAGRGFYDYTQGAK